MLVLGLQEVKCYNGQEIALNSSHHLAQNLPRYIIVKLKQDTFFEHF